MALVWAPRTTPATPGDERVSVTIASCAPFRATVYAYEPDEETYFFDIEYVHSGGFVAPYTIKDSGDSKITGVLNTPVKAQRAAALKPQALANKMTATLGVVK